MLARGILALAALFWLSVGAQAQTRGCIAVDGDTIRCGDERIRILGLDTPETYFALCDKERALGYQAAGRLQRLLNTRRVVIVRDAKRDKYRRTLAHVRVGGEDVGQILIREGLARPYYGKKRLPWC